MTKMHVLIEQATSLREQIRENTEQLQNTKQMFSLKTLDGSLLANVSFDPAMTDYWRGVGNLPFIEYIDTDTGRITPIPCCIVKELRDVLDELLEPVE